MGILDKLKPLPRWKHADAAVRLEAIRELDDTIELAALAESDADARVRRAAIAKVADADVLGRIAGGDGDDETRDRAADRLLTLATTTGPDPAVALAAVRQIADPRRLSTIAKSSSPEAVCVEALARVIDERGLGSIARTAAHESVARAAVDRLTDAAEILEVAQLSEHKDVALLAFDRIASRETDLTVLRGIEAKAHQKAVSKKARALVQEIEAAEAARRSAEQERLRQQTSLCEATERLSTLAADVVLIRAELARIDEAWKALDISDAGVVERFTAARADVETTIERREREAEEAAQRARLRSEAMATCQELCARVEALEGDDVLAQLTPIEEEWRSLLPLVGNSPEADRVAERFAQAVAACRTRHDLRAVAAETRVSFETLVAEAEGLPALADQSAAAARWQAVSREARGFSATLTGAGKPADDLHARMAAVDAVFAGRESARHEAAQKAQQDVLAQLTRLAERARRASEAETITLREGDRLMRDMGVGLDAATSAHGSREIEDAAATLRSLQEKVAPRVRELREMDDWRRFANAQRQEQLIAMAEAIVASLKSEEEAGKTSDLAATARALRELHVKWQEVAEAPRNAAQRLWDRFRVATDFIRARCEGYFAKMREERTASIQKRASLVEEAEALANSTDWGRTTARFQQLQVEWQQAGPVGRDAARELAQRFRTASNAFFSRRREDLTERKKTWTDNLSKKEALCARAEALAESTEWDSAAGEIKRLQAEWKTVGPVRRNKSDVVWNRFRAAADRFFERYHNRHQITFAAKLAERETMVVELESLAASNGHPPENLAARVQELRTTWNRSVPIPAPEMKLLSERWHTAFARIVQHYPDAFRGSDLDPAATLQRMEKLVNRIEAFLKDVREPAVGQSQAEILAARLRSALASNAMGGRGSEDAKWRAAADAVKDAQSSWQRLPPVVGPESQEIEARFRDACRKVLDLARRHSSAGGGSSSSASSARRAPNRPAAAAV